MDQSLPRILQRNPVWPSTFPKILAVAGIIVGLIVLFTAKPKAAQQTQKTDGVMDITRLGEYHIVQALALVGLMIATALTLVGNFLADIGYAWLDPRVSVTGRTDRR